MKTAAVLYNDDSEMLQHGDAQARIAWEGAGLQARVVAAGDETQTASSLMKSRVVRVLLHRWGARSG